MSRLFQDFRSYSRRVSSSSITVHERRRAMVSLFAGVIMMTIATVAASTMGTLVAGESEGSAWSGVPNGAGVLGTAIGTTALAALMARYGRRAGLLAGYLTAVIGALVA